MKTPHYREKYLDFPEIPEPKRWKEHTTDEQIITRNLLEGKEVSEDDREKLKECIAFYDDVIPKLRSFDLKSLSDIDIVEFLEYFHYVFTYLLANSNDLHIYRLYRLVENEAVLQKRERIRDRKYVSYPPIDVVKKKGRFNRVNTPNFNIFYGTPSIDDALRELKPDVGQLVTVGEWLPASGDEVKLISYPICPNPLVFSVNQDAAKGYFAFKKMTDRSDPLLSAFVSKIYSFINDEFAKPVDQHLEYLYSALFAERVFDIDDPKNPNYNYECIIYPSVGNRLEAQNLALKPSTIDQKFKLWKVYEFEITATHYDKISPRNSPEEITMVDFTNFESTDWVERDGYITW